MKKLVKLILIIFIILILFSQRLNSVLARQGCCSWHGGVSHCDTSVGRYVCNDGTYSPSCGCAYVPPKPKPTIKIPTVIPTPYRINTPTPSYKAVTQQPVNDSDSSDDGTKGLLTLSFVTLGGGFYWVYRRLKKESEG